MIAVMARFADLDAKGEPWFATLMSRPWLGRFPSLRDEHGPHYVIRGRLSKLRNIVARCSQGYGLNPDLLGPNLSLLGPNWSVQMLIVLTRGTHTKLPRSGTFGAGGFVVSASLGFSFTRPNPAQSNSKQWKINMIKAQDRLAGHSLRRTPTI